MGKALQALLTLPSGEMEPRMVTVRDLASGMVLDQDLQAANGVCLCSSGQEVTGALLQRIHTIAERIGVAEPFRVLVAR